MLISGTVIIGVSSFVGGLAGNEGLLVAARLAQGIGAALMLPAALSILTTTFSDPADRAKALGVWGGVGGLASAAGVLLGGVLTEGPGWRWVMFVNPIASVFVLAGVLRLIPSDRRTFSRAGFDVRQGRGRLQEIVGSRHKVRLNARVLRSLVPDIAYRDVYICGPDGFSAEIAAAARELGTDPEQIHTETFGF